MSKEFKFIVDHNAGKLVKLLRLMGYDTIFFHGKDDSSMITTALAEDRIIITRDTHIMERRVVTSGRLKVILIESDRPGEQIRQVVSMLQMDCRFKSFTLCLECNVPLIKRTKEEVRELVPPYVFKTRDEYMQCPSCRRIYWKGTHWQKMTERLQKVSEACQP